jgi:glyoxylase-like metal-dependent hydrolase (beta-lactamase superfamily II)
MTLRALLPAAIAILLIQPSPASAHSGAASAGPAVPDAPEPRVKVEKVGEGSWCLFGQGGNVGVVVTPSSVLVVDTQYAPIAPELLAEIRRLSPAPIEYVVNTHFHEDHTGGNAVMVREAPSARIVGHENVRRSMYGNPPRWAGEFPSRIARLDAALTGGAAVTDGYRSAIEGVLTRLRRRLDAAVAFDPASVTPPAISYGGSMRLFPGGEEIVLIHEAPGHTDGDSIVWVPSRNVVHMGDLFWNGIYPFIDVDGGGGSEGWIRNLDAILAMIPPDARVIAGHGPVGGPAELRRFRSYLADLRSAVGKAIAEGRTLDQAIAEIRLDGYEEIKASFMNLSLNIHQVWLEMGGSETAVAD